MIILKKILGKKKEVEALSEQHLVIIGNGISGITAARHIRKLTNLQITIISAESQYFYSRTALMYLYMGQMKPEHTEPYERSFWKKNRINLIFDKAESVDFENHFVQLGANTKINFDYLILATGSKPRWPNWAKTETEGLYSLYSLKDLDKIENATKSVKKAVIVGGGLIGVELAEMLHSRNIEVTMLIREQTYWGNVLPPAEGKIIEQEIKKHGIKLIKNELVEQILTENGKVAYAKTDSGQKIEADFIGVSVGVEPNIDFLQNTDLQTNMGILVDEYLHTNLKNVYAIGDCAEQKSPKNERKSIEQIWYTGKEMGYTVAQTIAGQKTKYNPGVFYNSAKFFELDYSVYGQVPNINPEALDTLYWENQKKNQCVRIVFEKATQIVVGIHVIGLRLRQSTCMAWINQSQTIEYVKSQLKDLHFDPEFSINQFSQIAL